MDLDSLRCFEAAATTLNFRAASARVHLSPAAFSDRIQRLEEHLKVDLFVRTTRQVQLSESGQRLLPAARQVLDAAERLRTAARTSTFKSPYELYIGTRYELGLSWLVPALAVLEPPTRADHPPLQRRYARPACPSRAGRPRCDRFEHASDIAEADLRSAAPGTLRTRGDVSSASPPARRGGAHLGRHLTGPPLVSVLSGRPLGRRAVALCADRVHGRHRQHSTSTA
jgi:hypothetical protein